MASWESLCVIAKVIPILLRAHVAHQIRKGVDGELGGTTIQHDMENVGKEIRRKAIKMWQANWESTTKG